jgi:flagellar biosynthetic protein FlhB
MLVAAVVGGIAGNVVQVGFLVSFKALNPDPNRINPVSGVKNLLKPAKIVDLAKNVLKVIAVGWVAYLAIRGRFGELPYLSDLPPRTYLVYLLELGFDILKYVLLVYVVIALLDYALQRRQHQEGIKMSKQDVRDEFKDTEGDPLIKSRIRSLQREMARRRMMAEVPTSDVVITNPTHFAVALRYDQSAMDAPRVTAKGTDLVAEKIVALAQEHGVPLYEAPPVARALFRQTEVGDPIPVDLFHAVAEILAQVYRIAGEP